MQRYLILRGIWGQEFVITAVTIYRKHYMPLGGVFLEPPAWDDLYLVISLEQQYCF